MDLMQHQSQFIFTETHKYPFMKLLPSKNKMLLWSYPTKREQVIPAYSKLFIEPTSPGTLNGEQVPRYQLFIASIGE